LDPVFQKFLRRVFDEYRKERPDELPPPGPIPDLPDPGPKPIPHDDRWRAYIRFSETVADLHQPLRLMHGPKAVGVWNAFDASLAQSVDPYESGEWIQGMVDKWGEKETLRYLKLYRTEYQGRLKAHAKALKKLPEGATISDMKAMVNKIKPGTYRKGRTMNNSVNVNTGVVKISPYVASTNMSDDLNSFLGHHIASVHEPVHVTDIANAKAAGVNIRTGQFGAQTEVNAYQVNVDTLDSAISYIKNGP